MKETIFNKSLRKFINHRNIQRLNNRDFTIISSNCNGALILHDLDQPFNSPFVNLWIPFDDFIKMLQNLPYYLSCDLQFEDDRHYNYPVGSLDDVKIYFQHYTTEEEAKQKWSERTKRINYSNLYIMACDRDGATYDKLVQFNQLPYRHKVVFTHLPHPELSSAFYIPGWERDDCIGNIFEYVNGVTGRKYYDHFDYVNWLNQ